LTAQFYTPASIIMVDIDENRLQVAKSLGATYIVNSTSENSVDKIMQLTENRGVDVAVEAVGIPATFDWCQSVIAPGGRIANVGVHGKSVSLHLETLWSKNITITTRLVDTISTPLLIKTITSKKLDPSKLITHHFALNDIMQAYDSFSNAAREKTLKVILTSK
jgi:alcohol dehydrogenase